MGYGALYVVDVLCERGIEPVEAIQGFSLVPPAGVGMGYGKAKWPDVCSG